MALSAEGFHGIYTESGCPISSDICVLEHSTCTLYMGASNSLTHVLERVAPFQEVCVAMSISLLISSHPLTNHL